MNSIEILRAALTVIEKPENWMKGRYAWDARKQEVEPTADDAVCWCPFGAIWKVSGLNGGRDAKEFLAQAILDLGGGRRHLSLFNDSETTTHDDVVRAFTFAIKLAEKAALGPANPRPRPRFRRRRSR